MNVQVPEGALVRVSYRCVYVKDNGWRELFQTNETDVMVVLRNDQSWARPMLQVLTRKGVGFLFVGDDIKVIA